MWDTKTHFPPSPPPSPPMGPRMSILSGSRFLPNQKSGKNSISPLCLKLHFVITPLLIVWRFLTVIPENEWPVKCLDSLLNTLNSGYKLIKRILFGWECSQGNISDFTVFIFSQAPWNTTTLNAINLALVCIHVWLRSVVFQPEFSCEFSSSLFYPSLFVVTINPVL